MLLRLIFPYVLYDCKLARDHPVFVDLRNTLCLSFSKPQCDFTFQCAKGKQRRREPWVYHVLQWQSAGPHSVPHEPPVIPYDEHVATNLLVLALCHQSISPLCSSSYYYGHKYSYVYRKRIDSQQTSLVKRHKVMPGDD
jgi:hypothetical protein